MVTLLITSVLILGLAAIAIYFWQKPATDTETDELLPATPPRGLFSDNQPITELTPPENNGHQIDWRSRIDDGDLAVLRETKNLEVYPDALNQAVAQATSDTQLLKLVSFVVANELPATSSLADAVMRLWEASPDRQTTAKMLHLAALSNDAEVYRNAIEKSLQFWREKKLPDVSASDLQALFDGEFWLLSSIVRSSGNGFILKRTLSSARRELEGTSNN
jgi:hypothetical protein